MTPSRGDTMFHGVQGAQPGNKRLGFLPVCIERREVLNDRATAIESQPGIDRQAVVQW